jgi:hypothetical protein
MLTYLWLEMNLLMLIMSNLFLQVSSQPAICLFFLLLCGHVAACPGAPATSSQPGPAAPKPVRLAGG